MSIKLNQRDVQVDKAKGEITVALGEIVMKHNLTTAEVVLALTELAHSWARHAVVDERS